MKAQIKKIPYGKTEQGQEVNLYRVSNNTGSYIEVLDYGCTVVGMYVHQRDQRMRNVLYGCETLKDCEQPIVQIGAIETDDEWEALLCKQVWQAQRADDHAVIFSACAVNNGHKVNATVKFRMKDFDRLVIDYSAATETGKPVTLTHKLCFAMDDELITDSHKMRVFVQKEINDSGKYESLHPEDSSAINYTPLKSEKHVYFSEEDIIHPFVELASDITDLALTAYSTMQAMEMVVCRESTRGVCLKACGSGTRSEERTVYGIDLLYHPEDKTQANPFMFFMPG